VFLSAGRFKIKTRRCSKGMKHRLAKQKLASAFTSETSALVELHLRENMMHSSRFILPSRLALVRLDQAVEIAITGHFRGWSLGTRFYPVLYLLTRMGRARDWGHWATLWVGAPQ